MANENFQRLKGLYSIFPLNKQIHESHAVSNEPTVVKLKWEIKYKIFSYLEPFSPCAIYQTLSSIMLPIKFY